MPREGSRLRIHCACLNPLQLQLMQTHLCVISCIAGVTQFKVGDEVFGIAPGCLGHSVIVQSEFLVSKPPFIGFEAAATTPTVYATVFQAFGDLSSFYKNQKVGAHAILVHIVCFVKWVYT